MSEESTTPDLVSGRPTGVSGAPVGLPGSSEREAHTDLDASGRPFFERHCIADVTHQIQSTPESGVGSDLCEAHPSSVTTMHSRRGVTLAPT